MTHKLRCWRGCLAVIGGDVFPENRGRVVLVVSHHQAISEALREHVWHVFSAGGPLRTLEYGMQLRGEIPDRYLTPITPRDTALESTETIDQKEPVAA